MCVREGESRLGGSEYKSVKLANRISQSAGRGLCLLVA